jgi:Domain of Unknown Function (DUF928)
MMRLKSLLSLTVLTIALPLEFTLSPIARSHPDNFWVISQAFRSPNRGAPPGGAGGGSRGSQCGAETVYMPLVPKDEIGLTVEANPTVLVYVPEAKTRQIVLTLFSRNGTTETQVGESVTFKTSGNSGIISVNLPATPDNGLKVDKLYRWEMEIECNPDEPSANLTIGGWVQRVPKTGDLANLNTNSTPTDYANNGIWYDAVASAAKFRNEQPDNPKIMADWEKLLSSVGLADVAKANIIECCTVEEDSTTSSR